MKQLNITGLVCSDCILKKDLEFQMNVMYLMTNMIHEDHDLSQAMGLMKISSVQRISIRKFFERSVDVSLLNFIREYFDKEEYSIQWSIEGFIEDHNDFENQSLN